MDLSEVRSLLNLATVWSVHDIYPQAVADEVVPFMVEEDGAGEVNLVAVAFDNKWWDKRTVETIRTELIHSNRNGL